MLVKPSDIPQDVWDAANSVCWKWANDDPPLIEEAMARAIMAERERADLRVKQLEDVLMEARLLLTPLAADNNCALDVFTKIEDLLNGSNNGVEND